MKTTILWPIPNLGFVRIRDAIMFRSWWLNTFMISAPLCILSGCGKSGADAPPIGDPKVLFDLNCSKCHAQAGEPGGPKLGSSKGPNLTHIGSESGRNAEWLAKFIRDPKSVRGDAKMPKFEGVMKEEEIRTLAEYLAGRK
jgi:mono/diheme cytochrome c family protein